MGEVKNALAHATIERIDELVNAEGENAATMAKVGDLLRELAGNREFRADAGEDPIDLGMSTLCVLARGDNGTRLEAFDERAWFAREKPSVHWHNYWQVLLLVRGNWQDTVWEPVAGIDNISPDAIRIARRDVLHPGDVQVLGPTEPHGWEAGEVRVVDDGLLLVWTGDDRGKPRSELDIVTGEFNDHWRSA